MTVQFGKLYITNNSNFELSVISTTGPGDAALLDRLVCINAAGFVDKSLIDPGFVTPAGPQGAAGATGPQGPVGPQGATGPTGAIACDASATSIASTTLAGVAGLSFALEAGQVYRFEFDLVVTLAGLASSLGVAVAYSGTSSAVFANVAVGTTVTSVSSLLTAVTGSLLLGGSTPVKVTGRIRATTAGTLSLQASRSAGTATLDGGCGQLSRV